jgi:hypothetical protein
MTQTSQTQTPSISWSIWLSVSGRYKGPACSILLVFIGLCIQTMNAFALPEDRNRPIHVASKAVEV